MCYRNLCEMLNNSLIDEIYDRRADNYKDIRHLYTKNAMDKRLDRIKTLVATIPPSQRKASNLKYKKLILESRLLQWKRHLYTDKTPSMTLFRWQLELTDKRYGLNDPREDNAARKREHLLPLLQMELYQKTDDQLREILVDIRKEDNDKNTR